MTNHETLIVATKSDCLHHFYKGGDIRLFTDICINNKTLPAGDYRINRIIGTKTMELIPHAAMSDLSDTGKMIDKNSVISVSDEECGYFVSIRIPSIIRSESSNQEVIAPFHLRESETDEEPEELFRIPELNPNLYTDYDSAVNAARLLAIMTGKDISICNGYSNSIDTISPEDVDENEHFRAKNKLYLRSISSEPYNEAEKNMTPEERVIKHNNILAGICPDCKHNRHDGVICYHVAGIAPHANVCGCRHKVNENTVPDEAFKTALRNVTFNSPPCIMHAGRKKQRK